MGKVLKDVLKKELGFGNKRAEKFMSAYMAECAVTLEILEPEQEAEEVQQENPPIAQVRYHAKERYVQRVLGLDFQEDMMKLYIKDNSDQLGKEMRDLYTKSTFLYAINCYNEDKFIAKRGFFIIDNIVFITNMTQGFLVTTYTISFNLPKFLEKPMIEALVQGIVESRLKLEEEQKRAEPIKEEQSARYLELTRQKALINEEITRLEKERVGVNVQIKQCKKETEATNATLDLHRKDLAEKADYIINNKNYSEDEIL